MMCDQNGEEVFTLAFSFPFTFFHFLVTVAAIKRAYQVIPLSAYRIEQETYARAVHPLQPGCEASDPFNLLYVVISKSIVVLFHCCFADLLVRVCPAFEGWGRRGRMYRLVGDGRRRGRTVGIASGHHGRTRRIRS